MVERHKGGKTGKRGIDLMPEMFADLIAAMDRNESDILGDLFQGSITYGESGQYFSPQSIARLLAELSVDPDAHPVEGRPVYISDPCCGTGRMLLEASNINPHAELIGVDIDARCAKISAINLGLRGRYGWVVCGNSLSGETQFAYRVGSFFHESPNGLRRGVIRDVPPELAPVMMATEHVRSEAGGLFAGGKSESQPVESLPPGIIEIPRSVLRLERHLAMSSSCEEADSGELDSNSSSHGDLPRNEPPTQQDLF